MIYYAIAMTVTLILCYYNTTVYSLPNGAQAKCFRSWKAAFITLLPLTFLAVFRWDVGWDSAYQQSYWTAYHAAAEGNNIRDFEIGFYLFSRLLAVLKLPYFWYLFIHGMLFMACVSYAISLGSVGTKWSILVFFLLSIYFDCYSSLRQSLAEAISLIAWAEMGYAKPSRIKDLKVLSILLVASLFHQIALLNIVVYFLCRIRFSRDGLLKFLVSAMLVSPVLQVILAFIASIFASDYSIGSVARINAVMTGIFAFLCWYFYDELCTLDENAYMYSNFSVVIFVLLLNSGAMPLPFRVFDMLKVGYLFIIPYLFRGIHSKRVRFAVETLVVLILGAWFYNFYFIQDPIFAHYQTAFSDWNTIIHLP